MTARPARRNAAANMARERAAFARGTQRISLREPVLAHEFLQLFARNSQALDAVRRCAVNAALGSPGHIATIAFMQLTGAKLTVVPYRGTAPALNDVVGGHIQLLTDAMLVLLPMAKGGKVKGIAVTSRKRTKLAPDLPSAAESGVPGLDVSAWYGVWGPKGMPQDVVEKLNKAFTEATQELDKQGKLAAIGVEPVYETAEQFRAYTETEVARNAELLNSVGFQPE